jgi:hypothetical protein
MSHACNGLAIPNTNQTLFDATINMIEQYVFLIYQYNGSAFGKIGSAPLLQVRVSGLLFFRSFVRFRA